MRCRLYLAAAGMLLAGSAGAKIDLVTLPERDSVELTIYNEDDLTMVRERRVLTLSKGTNRLEFGWANTLIDPTSLRLSAVDDPGKIQLLEVRFDSDAPGSAVWTVMSELEGPVPVDIRFFTTSISWQAYYTLVLAPDGATADIDGQVRVNNFSGEDYLQAKTRLVVGDLNLTESITMLASRRDAYGRPAVAFRDDVPMAPSPMRQRQELMEGVMAMADMEMRQSKSITKTAVSEFFLYDIEGTEDLRDGWGRRLPSLRKRDVPVENLYRYDASRYGEQVRHLLRWTNDKASGLGEEPLPNGKVSVFHQDGRQLDVVGDAFVRYIPVNESVELDLGASNEVQVTLKKLASVTENHQFDVDGNIHGFDRRETWAVQVRNFASHTAAVQVEQLMQHGYWDIQQALPAQVNYEKLDLTRIRYDVDVSSSDQQQWQFDVVYREGIRQREHGK